MTEAAVDTRRAQKAECRNSLWAAPLHDRTVPFYKLTAEKKLALLVKIELENDRLQASLPCKTPAISAPDFGARYTCRACALVFEDSNAQRLHFKSAEHLEVVRMRSTAKSAPQTESTTSTQQKAKKNLQRTAQSPVAKFQFCPPESEHQTSPTSPSAAALPTLCVQCWNVLLPSPPNCLESPSKSSLLRFLLHNSQSDELSADLQPTSNLHDAAKSVTDRVWVVFLYRSGEFAGAIFRIFGGDFQCVAHKALHKYTVRRKQGGSQAKSDSSGTGKAKSVGASLRRRNQEEMEADIQTLMAKWDFHISKAELIFVACVKHQQRVLMCKGKSGPGLRKNDPRIRRVPFTTYKPTFTEAKRVFENLCQFRLTYGDGESSFGCEDATAGASREKGNDDEEGDRAPAPVEDVGGEPPTTQPARDSVPLSGLHECCKRGDLPGAKTWLALNRPADVDALTELLNRRCGPFGSTPLHYAAAPPTDKANKDDEGITPAQPGHTTDTTERKKTDPSDPDDLVPKIEKGISFEDRKQPNSTGAEKGTSEVDAGHPDPALATASEAEGTSGDDASTRAALISWLLSLKCDPTIRDFHNRAAYHMAATKQERNSFRKFMGEYPDAWDYKAACIPSPLVPHMSSTKKDKRRRKRRRRKAKKKMEKMKALNAKQKAQPSKATAAGGIGASSAPKNMPLHEQMRMAKDVESIAATLGISDADLVMSLSNKGSTSMRDALDNVRTALQAGVSAEEVLQSLMDKSFESQKKTKSDHKSTAKAAFAQVVPELCASCRLALPESADDVFHMDDHKFCR